MNSAQVLPTAQFIVKPTNSTVQLEKMKMDADYPTNVLRKKEDLMASFAHSTAQKNVTKDNFSVLEVLMKLDAKPLANVETKKSTNGDQELRPNQNPNALDIVHPNVLLTKFFAHLSLILVTVVQLKKYVEKPSKTRTVFSAQEKKSKDWTPKIPLSEKADTFPTLTIAQNFAEKKKEKFCAQHTKTIKAASQRLNV